MLVNKRMLGFFILALILLGILSTTILVDRPVEFPDEKLELAIRDQLIYYDKPIFRSQLFGFIDLDLSNKGITNIEGIEYFRNLEILNLRGNQINDVSPLKSLNNLRILDLGYNQIVDLKEASFDDLHLLQLVSLNLDHNTQPSSHSGQTRLSDITLLRQFTSLVRLSLDDNHIADLSPVSELLNLEELILIENRLERLTGLEALIRLKTLNLRENRLTDISAIGGLTNLTYLNLHSNSDLHDVSPLENLTNLETLILRNVPIGDQINALENMTRLQRLNIRNCAVTDVSFLVELMKAGALQDNPDKNVFAYLDILDNNFPDDPYELSALRPFWDNIAIKYPAYMNDAILPAPEFSILGGFYEDDIVIEMRSEIDGAAIYYSLDGSIPTRKSLLYTHSILIEAPPLPPTNFMSATVLRARVFEDEGYDTSPIITHTFFVYQDSKNVFSLPVVSLATESENFFNPEFGIYQNFRERGKKWERPIHMEFYDAHHNLAFQKDALVRIHGSTTRGFAQKSLRFYGENYGGDLPYFDFPFFDGYKASGTDERLTTFKTILFRNSGNDYSNTFFKDAFIQQLVAHTSLDIQAYQPVNVYLSGRYWGIYNVRERLDEFYLENHYQLSPDEVTIHKIVADEDFYSRPSDMNEFLELRAYILNHDMADDETYQYVSTQIDFDNYIDNQIIYIYAANGDWLKNNVMFWKKNVDAYDSNALPGHDGRWRWMVIDMDLGFRDAQANLLSDAVGEHQGAMLTNALLKNDQFRLDFINRFADHLNTSFHPNRVVAEIDRIEAMLEPDMNLHILRWKTMGNSIEQWHENVDFLREFAVERPDVMRQQILEEFDLSGTINLSINVDRAAGFVRVNSLDILESTPGVDNASVWSGIYFKGVPITLTAIPMPGYTFSHWELNNQLYYDETIILDPDKNLHLTALFLQE